MLVVHAALLAVGHGLLKSCISVDKDGADTIRVAYTLSLLLEKGR